jgi:deoxyribodipyrimidine photolyase-related protein
MREAFDEALKAIAAGVTGAANKVASARGGARSRRWLYVPYDQLTDAIGPLSREDPRTLGIVLVESGAKASRRPYHQAKLALVLASQREFALEQAARGVAIELVSMPGTYAEALTRVQGELGAPLTMMEAAERELRVELAPLVERGALEVIPHEGWLTTADQFRESQGAAARSNAPTSAPHYRMDAFYRVARRATGLLMVNGSPEGGRFSFDGENRLPWHGTPPAPEPPRFAHDAVSHEVFDFVRTHFAAHPGHVDEASLPTTKLHAGKLWAWAKAECLPHFGPYEDAMSTQSRGLFHTRISPLLNNLRLSARRVVDEVAAMPVPLPSREGFVRQVLGWREFVRHVHRETDGFRGIDTWPRVARSHAPGETTMPLPPTFWGGAPSGLSCLDHVVDEVWATGYGHHITRLMVLGNLATLLDVSPRELSDWFWVAYLDAYDWVVEPNVLGMATFGVGPVMTTKPYVAGAPYLDRMSDYCDGCAFDPKKTCPITRLYWAYLRRHEPELAHVDRMKLPLIAARKRALDDQTRDAHTFDVARERLTAGKPLSPESLGLPARRQSALRR